MLKKTVYISLFVLVYACVERRDQVIDATHEATSQNCFEQYLQLDGNVYGSTRLVQTRKGHFMKYTLTNTDSLIVSIGSGLKEVFIDTCACSEETLFNRYHLTHETDYMMVVTSSAGTNTWLNRIYSIPSDTLYNLSAVFIDTAALKCIEISHPFGSDSLGFRLHDLYYKKAATVWFDYFEGRHPDGYPLFYIQNVALIGDYIHYTVADEDSLYRTDSIKVEL